MISHAVKTVLVPPQCLVSMYSINWCQASEGYSTRVVP